MDNLSYGNDEPYKFLIKDKSKKKPAKLTESQIFVLNVDKSSKKDKINKK